MKYGWVKVSDMKGLVFFYNSKKKNAFPVHSGVFGRSRPGSSIQERSLKPCQSLIIIRVLHPGNSVSTENRLNLTHGERNTHGGFVEFQHLLYLQLLKRINKLLLANLLEQNRSSQWPFCQFVCLFYYWCCCYDCFCFSQSCRPFCCCSFCCCLCFCCFPSNI